MAHREVASSYPALPKFFQVSYETPQDQVLERIVGTDGKLVWDQTRGPRGEVSVGRWWVLGEGMCWGQLYYGKTALAAL